MNCCLSVVLQLEKGAYPKNVHVVYHRNEQHSFSPFMCLDFIADLSSCLYGKEMHVDMMRDVCEGDTVDMMTSDVCGGDACNYDQCCL